MKSWKRAVAPLSMGVASVLMVGFAAPYAYADELPTNTDDLIVLVAGSASGEKASLESIIEKAEELKVPIMEVSASGKRSGADPTEVKPTSSEESSSTEATTTKPEKTTTPKPTSSKAPSAPSADGVFSEKNKKAVTPEKLQETIGKMEPAIEEIISSSPEGTRFFLAGEEAGAGALGNVVTKIGKGDLTNAAGEVVKSSSIVGTTLVSDPLRRGTAPIDDNSTVPATDKNLGGKTPGVGILGVRESDFGELQKSTVEICANGDSTCANSGMLTALATALVDGDPNAALPAATKALGSVEDILKMVQTLDQGSLTRIATSGATFGVAVASGNVPTALVSGGTIAGDLFAVAGPIVEIYESSENLPQINEALALMDPETTIGAKIWAKMPPEAATPEIKAVFSTIAKIGRSLNSIDKQRVIALGSTIAQGVAQMNPLIIPQVAVEIIQLMGQVVQAFINPGVSLDQVSSGIGTLNVSDKTSGTATSSSLSSLLSTATKTSATIGGSGATSGSGSGPDMSGAEAATGLGGSENAGTGINASSGVSGAPDYSTATLPGKSGTTATDFAPSWLESLAA